MSEPKMSKEEIDAAWEALSKEQLGSFLDDVRAKGAKAGAEKERAAIVAWLRSPEAKTHAGDIREAIEQGAHNPPDGGSEEKAAAGPKGET